MTRNSFRKLSFLLIAVVLFSTLYLSTTYATLAPLTPPPSGGYDAGSNSILDPGCAPTDTDCFVKTGLVTADNGLTATGSNVQLGGTLNNPGFYTVISGDGYTQGLEISGLDMAFFETNKDFFLQSNDRVVIRKLGGSTFQVNSNINLDFGSLGALMISGVAGTPGQVLTSNGSGVAPTWTTVSGSGWSLTGDSGTTAGTNFIGTTDAEDFVIKVDNNEMGRFYEDTGISTNSIAFGGAIAASSDMFLYGSSAGSGATNASNSNFFGYNAGSGATNASNSNFFGLYAGSGAINALLSNFFGAEAGRNTINTSDSNFVGTQAGKNATNASNSNFFGHLAGSGAANASNSIFIGQFAGNSDTVNNTGSIEDFSILIGKSTSTGGNKNSIAIGGSAINTASNQFMIGSATRPINTLVLTGASGNTCVLDVTVASPSCSSDETLKMNIIDLAGTTLENVLKIKTVSYNWKNYPNKGSQIGFLAQDLEQYFPEVVSDAPNGYKTVSYGGMTPILVQAIREMNLKITDINNTAVTNTWRDALIAWFGNIENGIQDLFVKRAHVEELCIGTDGNETCLSKDQVDHIINQTNTVINTVVPTAPPSDQTITDPNDIAPVTNDDSTGQVNVDNIPESTPVPILDPEPIISDSQ